MIALKETASLDLRPAQLLLDHLGLFTPSAISGPILDLASGECHNGIFLAHKGLSVICADKSHQALNRAKTIAEGNNLPVTCWEVDLEQEGINPFPQDFYGGILVFRYLHRPLISYIKKALKKGGILIYETFTNAQPPLGKPRNPDYLLRPGELRTWFNNWETLHYFEGIKENPLRAIAQIVCRKKG